VPRRQPGVRPRPTRPGVRPPPLPLGTCPAESADTAWSSPPARCCPGADARSAGSGGKNPHGPDGHRPPRNSPLRSCVRPEGTRPGAHPASRPNHGARATAPAPPPSAASCTAPVQVPRPDAAPRQGPPGANSHAPGPDARAPPTSLMPAPRPRPGCTPSPSSGSAPAPSTSSASPLTPPRPGPPHPAETSSPTPASGHRASTAFCATATAGTPRHATSPGANGNPARPCGTIPACRRCGSRSSSGRRARRADSSPWARRRRASS
jgi:hypothetical protein